MLLQNGRLRNGCAMVKKDLASSSEPGMRSCLAKARSVSVSIRSVFANARRLTNPSRRLLRFYSQNPWRPPMPAHSDVSLVGSGGEAMANAWRQEGAKKLTRTSPHMGAYRAHCGRFLLMSQN